MRGLIASIIVGAGRIIAPNPGNMGNSPGPAQVQVGSQNYIQRPMFGNTDICNVGFVPGGYVDGGGHPLVVEGLSGNSGGGVGSAVAAPGTSQGPVMSYDTQTGGYFMMGPSQ